MDFRYTPQQADLKARAAAYSQRLMEYENASEEAGGPLPADTVRELTREAIDAGVFAINMPAEWGGAGLSLLDQVIVEEEFGKVTNCLWDIPWRPANVLAYGTPAQREKYLLPVIRGERFDAFAVTEPDAGSDPGSGTSTADRAEDGWLLNGEKWFVTCGDIADFLLVQADAGPERQPTLFFVDKQAPGVRMTRVPRFMHSAVNGHPEFVFEDVFVPDEDVLGGVGNGYELTKEWFTDERLMIAARTTGAAERALELARDWALERRQFGSRIADFQLIQGMLADCAVDIAVNRAYTHQVAWEADQPDTDRKTLHAKASTAKLAASEAAGRVVD
ncbi:acyl-CoA dehydrogenase family protein, partial [Streptomyces sp. NPDC006283]|uniref:acyl-CoA dehydrogenase family protein n=1 Tax=Streptomyces sp. NPDC006283 TaxID=3156741 RepID=UPI0033BE08D6